MASGGVGVMDKPIQLQQQQRQQQPPQPQSHEALKCPRCDSSNTKFCYYNNYSLSQPRHFCKACKRYWTRGGTLRNVPVGGGCRKNKRVKKPIITTTSTAVHHVAAPAPPPASNHQTNPNPNPNPDHNHQIPSSTTSNSNHHLNPLFYGLLPQNPNYNPRFDSSITSETTGLYDLLQQPHIINAAASSGLGFSGTLVANHGHNSNLTFSSYMNSSSPMYAGGSTSSSTTMASLLASSLSQQQRFMGFASYDVDGSMVKDLKIEEAAVQNRMEWNNNNFQGQNNNNKNDHHQQQMEAVDDPNSLLWDTDQGGVVWLNDPATNNINGSSVPSLI